MYGKHANERRGQAARTSEHNRSLMQRRRSTTSLVITDIRHGMSLCSLYQRDGTVRDIIVREVISVVIVGDILLSDLQLQHLDYRPTQNARSAPTVFRNFRCISIRGCSPLHRPPAHSPLPTCFLCREQRKNPETEGDMKKAQQSEQA